MSKLALSILLFAFAFSLWESAKAQEIPSYGFSERRIFSAQSFREATLLNKLPIPTYIYQSASTHCALPPDQATEIMKNLQSSEAKWLRKLKLLFPSVNMKALRRSGVWITIDAFGDRRSVFSSFYVHRAGQRRVRMIGLDCNEDSILEWESLLIHEITHSLIEDAGLPAWMEEGLCQLMEHEVGGDGPLRSVKALSEAPSLPINLYPVRRPLPSSIHYGLSFLFMKYALAEAGWKPLQNWVRGLDSVVSIDLLRQFAFAFVLNTPEAKHYQIEGWNGLRQAFFNPILDKETLPRGGFLLFDGDHLPDHLPSGLEIYEITETAEEIRVSPEKLNLGTYKQNGFYLIFNPNNEIKLHVE